MAPPVLVWLRRDLRLRRFDDHTPWRRIEIHLNRRVRGRDGRIVGDALANRFDTLFAQVRRVDVETF